MFAKLYLIQYLINYRNVLKWMNVCVCTCVWTNYLPIFSVQQKAGDVLLLGLLQDCMHLVSAAWFYNSLKLIYGLWKKWHVNQANYFWSFFWSLGHTYSRSCVYAATMWTHCFSYLLSGVWACLSCTALILPIINSLHISPCIVVTWCVLKEELVHSFYYGDTVENICFNTGGWIFAFEGTLLHKRESYSTF